MNFNKVVGISLSVDRLYSIKRFFNLILEENQS